MTPAHLCRVIPVMVVTALTLALISFAATAAARTPESLTPEEKLRLAAGEILVAVKSAGGGGEIDAIIEIPATPAKLMAIMRDCGRATKFVDGLQSCHILSQAEDGRSDVREHIIKKFWLLPVTRSVFSSKYESNRSIVFKLVEGDLRAMEGMWRLEPLDNGNRTRLFYTARVDPGVPLPAFIVRSAIEAEIPKTLEALRGEAARVATRASP